MLKISSSKIPSVQEFPKLLKNIESEWKVKLMRRFERERFVGTKEEAESKDYKPRYILSMFPYPSGKLHLGHVRIYTSGDILARYSRLLSKNEAFSKDFTNVICPMGFDSFGLPAENAAKERKLNPATWTNLNIRSMKKQMDDLALQFDWREATSNPSFYKWTQEIFLKLMDAGLVYKSFAQVNWDPIDKTVLADEQVDQEGRSWRSGALVEKRHYRQWFIKVNSLTNDIYHAHDVDPDSWKDILAIQRNWIGQPCGWLFYLPVENLDNNSSDILPVFTKNPELFMNQTTKLLIYCDHWLEKVYNVSRIGSIRNPFTGGRLEISFTNDVEVLPPNSLATLVPSLNYDLTPNCHEDLTEKLISEQVILLAKLHGLGGYYTSDKYRDWSVSRQRFWGTPIPVIHCNNCGYVGVSKKLLPVKLPNIESLSQDDQIDDNHKEDKFRVIPPLERLAPSSWIETQCPTCNSKSKRECETFDTLFDSSWYFLRYATSPLNDKPFDFERTLPAWCYIGGKEHASMHLFYARFITHFLHSTGELKFKEPFSKLLVQGVVKGKTNKLNGRYLSSSEVDSLFDKSMVTVEYEKMSKSKGNGVDPQDLIDLYGVDATRFCLMNYANPRSERLWRTTEEEFGEVITYLRRVALTIKEYLDAASNQTAKIKELDTNQLNKCKFDLIEARNRFCIEATYNIQETSQFRQYIHSIYGLVNAIRPFLKNSSVYTIELAKSIAALIILLNPLAPHFSEELWSHFSTCSINPLKSPAISNYNISLQASDQPWPLPDKDYPLSIKVRPSHLDQYIERLHISSEELEKLDENGITQLVESHFQNTGQKCEVEEVKIFKKLLVTVVAKMDVKKEKKRKRANLVTDK